MFLTNFKTWLSKPFDQDMNATHWFMFFGLLIVISVLWGIILRHITAGIGEI
jgi:hypothetical protein